MKALGSLAILIGITVTTCFLGYCLVIGLLQVYMAIFGAGVGILVTLGTMMLLIVGLICLAIALKPITALLALVVLGMIDNVIKG